MVTKVLLVVLILLTAFQAWQTWELRSEIRQAVGVVNSLKSVPSIKIDSGNLKKAGDKFAEAAKAAASGNAGVARDAANEAFEILGKDNKPLRDDVSNALKKLEEQVKKVYNPSKKDDKKSAN